MLRFGQIAIEAAGINENCTPKSVSISFTFNFSTHGKDCSILNTTNNRFAMTNFISYSFQLPAAHNRLFGEVPQQHPHNV